MPHKRPRPAASGADRAAGLAESGLEHPFSRLLPPKNPDLALDLAEIKFQRAVGKLHRLGPRLLAEMLAELVAQHLLRREIEALAAGYAALDAATVDAVGGRDFGSIPLHPVRR